MIIRFAEEKDIEQINKLLVQVNSIHHRGRPDLFKSGKKKYTDEELRKIIKDNIYDKPKKHLFLEKSTHKEIKFMNQIGG